jgi:hypothetical protein
MSFNPEGAKDLILIARMYLLMMGDIEKGDRSNPKKCADHLDHFRYYCNQFHKNILRL